jgi:internalin A
MQKQRTAWPRLVVLAVLTSCVLGVSGGVEAEKNEAPRPLPPEIVKAWCDAGAKVGWMIDAPPKPQGGYEFWEPWREEVEPGTVPAFKFHPEKGDVLANLPDPGAPFGLDFHCSAVTASWLKKLARLKGLQSLNIGGSLSLTDAGLKELAELKNLQALYLFYTRVTDAGLKELAGLKNLQALDLVSTRVTDAGLKELAELKSLQALNLGQTQVTDAGLKDLGRLKSLQWLNLRRTKVTAAGVAALQKELPACKIVPPSAER